MSGAKLLLAYAAWLLAAAAISIVAALFVAEVAALLGAVSSPGSARTALFAIVLVAGFIVLAALPWLLRKRTIDEQ